MIRHSAIVLAALVCATPALGADANAGKTTFHQQCALCHSAQPGDNGGAQGPNLNGVFGRHSASDAQFGYTKAMQAANLTWDAATLNRFLASPTTVVPNSAMVIAIPKDDDRANVIAYFQAVKDGTFKEAERRGPPGGFTPPPSTGAPPKGDADWKRDVPGRVHRVNVTTLPAPFDSGSATNFPKVVDRPANAKLQVPAGFKVDVFASDQKGARAMRLAPNGDIFLTETSGGFVKVLRPSADGATAASVETFAQGLNLPFGMAFYPAKEPKWLYVAETNRVVRYAYKVGDQKAGGLPEIVVPELSPVGNGGHFTRDLVFSPDGKRMFVSVGSGSNVAEDMAKKTPEEAKAWEASNGLGATWGTEEKRADVLVFEVGSNEPGKVFATGIRNCAGLTMQPATGTLWCTTNERDMLGDDLVPDYSTRVLQGHFYGWPWYYMGKYEDPRLQGDRPDLAGKATVPDVPYQAHSAALNLVFYTATKGSSAFPKEYVGDGFAVMHGSWNRAFRTGHKIVRVRMKNGMPTGEYDDFLVGFIADDGNAWARPVGAVVASDGSLLMSEDGNNTIYRISYAAGSLAAAAATPPDAINIPGEKIFPESLTSTSDGSIIIGSIAQKQIYRAKPGASTAEVWIAPGTEGVNNVLGVFADNKAGTLYVCSNVLGPPGAGPAVNATLLTFDSKSGAPKGHYVFPTEKATCNDIAVDADGNAYATDTSNMEIVTLKKGGTALTVWAGNGAFGPKGGVLDGISVLGKRVVANTLATSKLWSVPIGADGKAGPVTEVKLDKEIVRPDGMRSFGKSDVLIIEGGNGGRLSRIALAGDTGKVTTVKEGYPDGPVAVTVVGTTAYVLEGQLAAFMRGPAGGAEPPPPKTFKATAVQVGKP